MPVSMSDALKEAYVCAPPSARILHTLILQHPALSILPDIAVYNGVAWTLALVQDTEDHTLGGRLHHACGFRFAQPARDTSGIQELSMAIDNTDERMSQFLEKSKKYNVPCVVRYNAYLVSDKTTPQLNPPMQLFMRDAVITPIEITATATFADIVNKKFPHVLYTRQNFPALGD